MDVNPKTNRVYVRHTGSSIVSRIVDARGSPVAVSTIAAGQGPGGLTLNRTTNRVYAVNAGDSSVSVIDGPSSVETARLAVNGTPQDVAVNPGSGYVYVANSPADRVLVFEEDRVDEGPSSAIASIAVGGSPKAIAVNSTTNRIYVANSASGTVSVIDERTLGVLDTIPVGLGPSGLAINQLTNRVYVANSTGNSLSIIDGERNVVLTSLVAVGGGPGGVAVNPLTDHVFVANRTDNTVSVVDGTSGLVLVTLPVGSAPMGVAVNTTSGRVYVANSGGASLSVIQDALSTATATPSPTPPTASPTPTAPSGPDIYEPDDTRNDSRPLNLVGLPQVHSIHTLGNEDWAHIAVVGAPQTIEISALSDCDLVLDLFDWDGVRLAGLGLNDDSGTGLSPRLVYTFASNGTYFVRVRHYVVEWPATGTATATPTPASGGLAAGAFAGPGLCREYALTARLLDGTTPTPTRFPSPTATATTALSGTVAPSRTRTPTRTPTVTRTPDAGPTVQRPFSWGADYFGQLGDASALRPAPSRLSATAVSGIGEALAVAAGGDHSLALLRDGTVRAWGVNTHGELGDGSLSDRYVPVPVTGLANVRAIAAGADHSLALTQAGRVYAWGHNLFGQLGTGTPASSTVPAAVSNLADVVAIAAGNGFSLALTRDGHVYGWGSNYFGQLGTGDTTDRSTPAAVSGLSGVVAIAAGGGHSLALQSDGRVKAWGHNASGQLGDGTTFDRLTPVTVADITSVAAIAAGFEHSLAIVPPPGTSDGVGATGGTVYGWGDNSSGQVGNGSIDPFHTRPRAVTGVTNAVAIAAGGSHSLAVRSRQAGRTVVAWGNNTRGQLGNSTTDDSLVPKDDAASGNTLAVAAGFFHSVSLRVVPAGGLPGASATPTPTPAPGSAALPQVIATITTVGDPADVAVNASTNRVYVSHIGVDSLTSTDQISVIDAATNSVTTVGLAVSTSGLAVNSSAGRLYLANFFEPSFTVLSSAADTLSALATIPVPNGPVAVAFNPSTGLIYVSSFSDHKLVVIDVSGPVPAVVATIGVPNNPVGVAINSSTNRIYVASLSGDSLSVVDGQTNAVIATIPTGDGALGVAVNPTTNRIFVTNSNSNTVTVLDGATNRILATVPVGPNPTGVAVNPATNHIFITNRDADTVEVLDGANAGFGVYARLGVGSKPFNLAVNPTTNRVYVANNGSSSVTIIQDYASAGTTAIGVSAVATAAGSPVVVPPIPTLARPATPAPRIVAPDILAWLRGPSPTPEATPQAPIGPPSFTRSIRARRPVRTYTEEEVEQAALQQARPGTGAQLSPLWPSSAALSPHLVITAQGERGAVRVEADPSGEEPVIIRLQPDAPAALPPAAAPPANSTVFQVDVMNVDGTPVQRHSQPLQICAHVSDAQLDEAGGDLSRFAILRWSDSSGYYERLPRTTVDAATREAQTICALTVETSTFVVTALPDSLSRRAVEDPRFFPETGFRVADDAFWNYFQRRGGLIAFGYPVSRQFQLIGTDVQFFQRRVLQRLPDGTVQQLNILDDSLFPFREINGSTFPAADPALLAAAPQPGTPDYATRALEFVRENAVLDFGRAYFATVTCADAYPGQQCSDDTIALLNLEMWGLPVSKPVLDPNYRSFAYQAFQRGILHYDFATDTTQGILLGDWWKALITGEGLPSDLEDDAINTAFWRQFDPRSTRSGMWWPEELPQTSMIAAFAPELPRERIESPTLLGAHVTEGG